MASSSKIALPSAVLALRILTLALLVASLAVIVTDKFSLPDDLVEGLGVRANITFKDVHAYRYVLAIAVVGAAYTLLQIPIAIVGIAGGKRVIGGRAGVAMFLISADVIFAMAIATGAAAGYGFNVDTKRGADFVFGLTSKDAEATKLHDDIDKFVRLASISSGLLLLAAVCMAFVIVLSVHTLARQ